MTPTHIGSYRVVREIGQGGMGVVYAAHDDRLDRAVAIKVVRPDLVADPVSRQRFLREARAAARVSHPHICPLYELAEDHGTPFLVMELLEGESLASRLERGAIPPREALRLANQMLAALAALHRRGIVHRDLKPANVFLTPHGVKLVDFGLAQRPANEDATREASLTGRGHVVGTPRYMAPEQLFGKSADERADVWAAAAVIYEMLAGRPAFGGSSLPEIAHAVGYEEPAALGDLPDLAAIDRALRPALAKDPVARIPRAEMLAANLDAALAPTTDVAARSGSTSSPLVARHAPRVTRFVALPLRVLRSDPDTDFLAFSVPDAVSAALASLESVSVRTPRATPAGEIDPVAIGRDWDVDVLLTGTLLRAGNDVRVSARLADATDGRLLWSHTAQAPLADLFQLQDDLTERIVTSLKLPLTARDRRALERQAPASAEAYELYMRANEMIAHASRWNDARALYERAVELDPTFAPAWARLGRARRVLAKWGAAVDTNLLPMAQQAFRRAFDLDPDSSIAHDLAAYVDVELGKAPEAMERLLGRAVLHPADPGVMAGLVTTCRYAGLLEASRAAHARAIAIDPAAHTSVSWTHFLLGDFAAAIATDVAQPPFCAMMAKLLTGQLRQEDIIAVENALPEAGARRVVRGYRLILNKQIDDAVQEIEALGASGFNDPEGWYLHALLFAHVGAFETALTLLKKSVDLNFACYQPLSTCQEWDGLRGNAQFQSLLKRTRELVSDAGEVYERAGGPALLGRLSQD
ncbi:MAG TPA: protein kinase [Vicinamibacterales bacterium]|nr:protein kinase [Vicinamibacterales bacterium]